MALSKNPSRAKKHAPKAWRALLSPRLVGAGGRPPLPEPADATGLGPPGAAPGRGNRRRSRRPHSTSRRRAGPAPPPRSCCICPCRSRLPEGTGRGGAGGRARTSRPPRWAGGQFKPIPTLWRWRKRRRRAAPGGSPFPSPDARRALGGASVPSLAATGPFGSALLLAPRPQGAAVTCLPSAGRQGWLLQGRLVAGLRWGGQRTLEVLFCVRHWTSLAWTPPRQDLEHCRGKRSHRGSTFPMPRSCVVPGLLYYWCGPNTDHAWRAVGRLLLIWGSLSRDTCLGGEGLCRLADKRPCPPTCPHSLHSRRRKTSGPRSPCRDRSGGQGASPRGRTRWPPSR